MFTATVWPGTVAALVVLATVTVIVLTGYRVSMPTAQVWALVRAAAQLSLLSVILAGVLTNDYLVAGALLVMFGVAVTTTTHRIGWSGAHLRSAALAMAIGAGVALTVVFASGALDFSGRYVLAVGGIVIGNTMTIATLTAQHFRSGTSRDWDQIEGWLSLGATASQATARTARRTVRAALIPATDQTRTTGLVTLPGAFVGALFGGASPIEAGRFQIIVLAAIMAAGSLTAVVLVRRLSAVALKPDEEVVD